MHVIKIIYSKGEEIKFVSHLDLLRVLERAIRRAEIPIAYSQGFNPRMKISYKTRALKVGETSDNCEAEITLDQPMNPEEFKDKLNFALPRGIRILETCE